jgi:hypothetical protein
MSNEQIRYSNETQYSAPDMKDKRGVQVYSMSDLMQVTGRDKEGKLISWGVEHPYFYLTISQREEMFRLSSPVFGLVSSRMNRLSGLQFNIVSEKHKEDEIVEELKEYRDIFNEYKNSIDIKYLMAKAKIAGILKETLPDLLPDLSNFEPSLLRWKNRIKRRDKSTTNEAKEWLMEPNQGVIWEDFVKKWVHSLLIHGASSVYKQTENNRLVNFDTLPGGTVYKIKSPYFSGVSGYIQVTPGYTEPKVYFGDELAYTDYLPVSSRNHGMIPLEALIKKVTESLLFDDKMANEADGTKPPEKMIIVTRPNPFGSTDADADRDLPLPADEQKRVEQKINDPVKEGVITFSGNSVEVVDLSRADTMGNQMQRQKDIREEVAMVFNATNMEVNLTGSDNTSGRSTSEAQMEIEQGKGVAPIAKVFSRMIEKNLLPFRFGPGLRFEFELGKNELEEKNLDLLMLQTGEMTKNDIREKYGKTSFGEEYDMPDGGGATQPGQDNFNPLFTSQV